MESTEIIDPGDFCNDFMIAAEGSVSAGEGRYRQVVDLCAGRCNPLLTSSAQVGLI